MKNLVKTIFLALGAICLVITLAASIASAQDDTAPAPVIPTTESFNVKEILSLQDPTDADSKDYQKQTYLTADANPVAVFLVQILNLITLSIATVSFVVVIIGGYYYLTSAGNSTQMNKGKEIITYAVIGLVISLASYWIVSFVQSLLFEIT